MKQTEDIFSSGGKLSRRDFLNLLKAGAVSLGLVAAGGVGWSYLVEPGWVQVENVTLNLPRLSSNFHGTRILQVSDIHMGGWMNSERLQHATDLILAQNPDLLLLTGDFLIGHGFDSNSEQCLQELLDILAPMAKSIPSFAVLGNHDYWTNADAVREMLNQSGITDLTNSVFTLSDSGQHLHICGVDDIWEGEVRLDELVSRLPRMAQPSCWCTNQTSPTKALRQEDLTCRFQVIPTVDRL
jgi:uncharacterized protein